MDLNKSFQEEFSSSPPVTPQQMIHNFMQIPPPTFLSPNNPLNGDAGNGRFLVMLRENMQLFWHQQLYEIFNAKEFRNSHQLPLARIKKIMKSDEEVKMISSDTPVLFSKACELFISELTLRSWLRTEQNRRRTLQRCDIATAIRDEELLDFLNDVVPLDHYKEDDVGIQHAEIEAHLANSQMPFQNMNMNMNTAFMRSNQEMLYSEFKYEAGSKFN